MPFVKLDCGILDSSLWIDRDARNMFITALLMATPYEVISPIRQLEVRTLTPTGWMVPPGWYGMVSAAGVGIAYRCGLEVEKALSALERLGSPDPESRSPKYDGRRLVRMNGGYLVLNFIDYRDKKLSSQVKAYKTTRACYSKYLRSRHWFNFRNKALDHYGTHCQSCGGNHRIEVHHLNYKHVGSEELSDVTVLCRTCHRTRHLVGKK